MQQMTCHVTHRIGGRRVVFGVRASHGRVRISKSRERLSSLVTIVERSSRGRPARSVPEDTPVENEKQKNGAAVDDGSTAAPGVRFAFRQLVLALLGQKASPQRPGVPVEAGRIDTWTILKGLVDIIRGHGRALIAIYVVTEAVNFLANRAFHRLTNQIAMTSLAIPQQAIGNVWWLSQNPDLLANGSAYQALTASVFLIAFPVSVLIKAVQSAYFYYVLCNRGDREGEGTGDDDGAGISPPENGFRPAVSWAKSQLKTIAAMAPSLFTVEFLVSLVVIPLQFASLLVFTLPFTLPVIMSVHVALPVAIGQNIKGWKAVQASRHLMKPIRWQAAIPFVFIIIVQRMIDLGQGKIISSLPSRFYYELLEIPVGVLAVGFGLSVVASVMRTSLPFLLFNLLEDRPRDDKNITEATS